MIPANASQRPAGPNRAQRRAAARSKPQRRSEITPVNRRERQLVSAIWREEQHRRDASTHSESELLQIAIHSSNSLDKLVRGEGTDLEVANLDLAAKISHEMALGGYGTEARQEFAAACAAIEAVYYRGQAMGGRYVMKAHEIKALQMLVELQEQQMQLKPTAGEMRRFMTAIGIPASSVKSIRNSEVTDAQ